MRIGRLTAVLPLLLVDGLLVGSTLTSGVWGLVGWLFGNPLEV